jgi:DNA-binding response OmpR family regulator
MTARKILVVDDEPSYCELVREFLEASGYDVILAFSGEEAIQAYQLNQPQMVLLDIRMPGKDGLETLLELKTLDPGAMVIMLTAVSEEEIADKAKAIGAFNYLTKPIKPSYLLRFLNAVGSLP